MDGGELVVSGGNSRICSPEVCCGGGGGGIDGGGPNGGIDLHSLEPLLLMGVGDESQPFNSGVVDIIVDGVE